MFLYFSTQLVVKQAKTLCSILFYLYFKILALSLLVSDISLLRFILPTYNQYLHWTLNKYKMKE